MNVLDALWIILNGVAGGLYGAWWGYFRDLGSRNDHRIASRFETAIPGCIARFVVLTRVFLSSGK